MGIWVQKEETGTVEMQMSGRSSGRAALATTTDQPMPRDQLSTMIQGVSAAVEELVLRTAQLRGLARLQRRGDADEPLSQGDRLSFPCKHPELIDKVLKELSAQATNKQTNIANQQHKLSMQSNTKRKTNEQIHLFNNQTIISLFEAFRATDGRGGSSEGTITRDADSRSDTSFVAQNCNNRTNCNPNYNDNNCKNTVSCRCRSWNGVVVAGCCAGCCA
jgi:hypothetical protein